MELFFATARLAKACSSDKEMRRQFGTVRARRLAVRLQQLRLADSLADLEGVAGRFHELTQDLDGQYAVDLDGPYRLLFSAVGADGIRRAAVDRSADVAVVVEGIHDYH